MKFRVVPRSRIRSVYQMHLLDHHFRKHLTEKLQIETEYLETIKEFIKIIENPSRYYGILSMTCFHLNFNILPSFFLNEQFTSLGSFKIFAMSLIVAFLATLFSCKISPIFPDVSSINFLRLAFERVLIRQKILSFKHRIAYSIFSSLKSENGPSW